MLRNITTIIQNSKVWKKYVDIIITSKGFNKSIREKVNRKMSLNVSYNQIASGIDTAALKEVTKQIFNRANSQNNSALANADLTKFNRVSLGTSLYNVNASQASKIAMASAGVNINLSDNAIQSLKYLNSQASKSIFNIVEGKIALPETQNAEQKDNVVKLPSFGRLVENVELSSDKKGSNPFYNQNNSDESSQNDNEFNFFA